MTNTLPNWTTHVAISNVRCADIQPACYFDGEFYDEAVTTETVGWHAAFRVAYWRFIPKLVFLQIEECRRTGKINPSLFVWFR